MSEITDDGLIGEALGLRCGFTAAKWRMVYFPQIESTLYCPLILASVDLKLNYMWFIVHQKQLKMNSLEIPSWLWPAELHTENALFCTLIVWMNFSVKGVVDAAAAAPQAADSGTDLGKTYLDVF